MFNTPIVLICFNRPLETKKVFNKIKFIKPKKLFLIMDGPRRGSNNDIVNCFLVKNIITQISWKCRVYKNFSKKNLRSRSAASSSSSAIHIYSEHILKRTHSVKHSSVLERNIENTFYRELILYILVL